MAKKTAKKTPKSSKSAKKAVVKKPLKTAKKAVKKTVKKVAEKAVKKVVKKAVKSVAKPKKAAPPRKTSPQKPEVLVNGLTAEELTNYQAKLIALRDRLTGEVRSMTNAALLEKTGYVSAMPQHMADVGSDSFEQEQTLSFAQSENQTLHSVDEALQRIKNGTYGVCEDCGCNIPKPRLNFIPFTATCVNCVEETY